jgi:WD40 repeat protein
VAFSPDGKSVAAVAFNGAIERWASADGKLIDTTPPPTGLPVSLIALQLAFASNDRVVAWALTGTATPAVVVWEAPSGKFLSNPTGHTAEVRALAFDDGKHLLSSGADRQFLKWDAATGKQLGTVALKPGKGSLPPATADISRDGKRALSGNQPASVFDLTTGEELLQIPRNPGNNTLWLSADGARVLVVTAPAGAKKATNGTAQVWDIATKKKTAEIEVPFDRPGAFAASLSPSGERLVVARVMMSAAARRPAMVVTGWDLKTGKKLGEVDDLNPVGQFRATAISEVTVVVSSSNGRVRLFDYELGRGGEELEPLSRATPPGAPAAAVLSADGKRFAFPVPTKDPTVFGVRVHDWPSGKALHTFSGHKGPVTALAFNPDGKTLASGSTDGAILLWDMTKIGVK